MVVACGFANACGGAANRGPITISGIERATRAAHSVRFIGDSTDSSDPRIHAQVTGVADFDRSFWRVDATSNERPVLSMELLVSGKQVFISLRQGSKKEAPCLSGGQSKLVGFRPDTALKSFESEGWKIDRVGNEKVRGVKTTHYRLTRAPDPADDIWVDHQGRLRRMIDRNDTEVDTVEFYDYGADIGPVTIPPPTPCKGLFGP